MEGLSTLNGPLRLRDGRNDWMRDFASALEGYRMCLEASAVAPPQSVFANIFRVSWQRS